MEYSHTSSPLLVLSLCLSAAFFFTTTAAQQAPASAPSSAPTPAPSSQPPSPPVPFNVTEILEKSGQFTVLVGLLVKTRMGNTLSHELNTPYQGLTFLAPTDGAFAGLGRGYLSNQTTDQLSTLINAHVVPHFFAWDDFKNLSSAQSTQASGPGGPYKLFFSYLSSQQVNVSTGAVETVFSHAVNLTKPLAIYQVEKVLLPVVTAAASAPSSGSPPPARAPSGKVAPASVGPKAPGSAHAEAPGSGGSQTGAAPVGVSAQWGLLAVACLVCAGLMM